MEAISASGSPLSLLRTSLTSAISPIPWSANFKLNWKKGKIHGAQDQLPSQSQLRLYYVRTPEYTYLPVGLHHLIFKTLLLPLDLLSELVRQFIPVENSSVQVKAARVIWLLTISAENAAEGWALNTQLPMQHMSLTMQTECQYTRKAWTNVTQAQTPGDVALPLCIDTFRSLTCQCVGKC